MGRCSHQMKSTCAEPWLAASGGGNGPAPRGCGSPDRPAGGGTVCRPLPRSCEVSLMAGTVPTRCPYCETTLGAAPQLLGREGRCPRCGRPFTITPLVASPSDVPTPGRERFDEAASPSRPATASGGRDPTVPRAPAAGVPETIGRFLVREQVGAGGFGRVYRAFDPVLGREVALKVLHAGALTTPRATERFAREARATAQLRHPRIVPIYEAGIDGPQPYLASAYVAGRTLADLIDAANERQEPIDPRRAAAIARDLAEALDHAPRPGDRPPRRQAGQRHGRSRAPGLPDGLRPGAPRVLRREADAGGRDRRDPGLPRPRAGPRQWRGHALQRPVQPGCDPLRVALRPDAVLRPALDPVVQPGPPSGPLAPRRQSGGPARPGDDLPEGAGQGAVGPLHELPHAGRGPRAMAGWEADPGPTARADGSRLGLVPAEPGPGRVARGLDGLTAGGGRARRAELRPSAAARHRPRQDRRECRRPTEGTRRATRVDRAVLASGKGPTSESRGGAGKEGASAAASGNGRERKAAPSRSDRPQSDLAEAKKKAITSKAVDLREERVALEMPRTASMRLSAAECFERGQAALKKGEIKQESYGPSRLTPDQEAAAQTAAFERAEIKQGLLWMLEAWHQPRRRVTRSGSAPPGSTWPHGNATARDSR